MTHHQNKNVIFVVLDTHRYDRLGSYGYDRPTSPNLDSFASECLFFKKAIAPGQWTIPSHASMFSGEVPAVHRTVQADDALPKEFRTLADRLSHQGIQTTGFCNNPLVGVLQNGFKRGFDRFYNYCGMVPSTPQKAKEDIWKPIRKLWSKYTQLLRRLSYPIQNTFASPNEFFLAALRPLFVPLWTRAGNFKGMTERSIKETTSFVEDIEKQGSGGHFIFLNLMETHLPYSPPDEFVRKFVPYFYETPEAQQFMRNFNRKAMQWLIPLIEPLKEVESATISDMYDAEVAYQDHLLAQLFTVLDSNYHRDNSMVIFLADHGEMLGEHGYMGHGFGVHEELIHVPLFIRVPGSGVGKQIHQRVSLTQVFYTVLDYFGFDSIAMPYADEVDVRYKSLLKLMGRDECTQTYVFSEAYAPENALTIINKHAPELMGRFHADHTYRAVYKGDEKMIAIEGLSRVLYNLTGDPNEAYPYQDKRRIDELAKTLDAYIELAETRRKGFSKQKISLKDELIQERLRDLGYLE
jgi:arylsulfatase A-like enzyme